MNIVYSLTTVCARTLGSGTWSAIAETSAQTTFSGNPDFSIIELLKIVVSRISTLNYDDRGDLCPINGHSWSGDEINNTQKEQLMLYLRVDGFLDGEVLQTQILEPR